MSLFQNLILCNSSEEVKGEVVYCIAHLGLKCPTEFASFAPEFAAFLVSQMNGGSFLCLECLNAYGYLLQTQRSATKATVQQMIPLLMKSCENSEEFECGFPYAITVADSAINVLCCSVAAFPHELVYLVPVIVELIKRNMSMLALSGVSLILGVDKSQSRSFCEIFLETVTTGANYEYVSEGFNGLAMLVAAPDCQDFVPSILKLAFDGLKCELFCFVERSYNDLVCNSAQSVFREFIKVYGNEAVKAISGFLSDMMEAFRKGNWLCEKIRCLNLEILGDVIVNCSEVIDEDFARSVLVFGMKEANYVGFACVKNVCGFFPGVVAAHLEPLLSLFIENITENHRMTKGTRMMLDNLLSAFGLFLMNCVPGEVLDSIISVDLLRRVLDLMSPSMDIMKFFEWLMERRPGGMSGDFAAVMVRFFSEPVEYYAENGVSEEDLKYFVPVLRKLLGEVGSVQEFCLSVLHGDKQRVSNVWKFLAI
jgi:hypothetical protein